MFTINGELCYSPRHPKEYGLYGLGHGQMYGSDLQLWNLMYLSLPGVEGYLVPGMDPEAVYNSIPVEQTASCIALVRGDYMMREYPRMRYWLTLPPDMFAKHVLELPVAKYCALPTAMNIPDWSVIIMMRAKQIRTDDPASKGLGAMLERIKKEIGA